MKRFCKNKKGITLVALIITVIVMLILAGVAISVIVDGEGLFSRTRKAAQEYENAAKNEEEVLQEIINDINVYLGGDALKTDGSWNTTKKVNSPKLADGMIPIYWNENGEEIELTKTSTEEEWNNWYNYIEQEGTTENGGTSKWANAVTKNDGADNVAGNEDDEITGYWVWIPRYEYKLTAPANGETAGTIAVNFIRTGTTTASSTDYKVHPVFFNDTSKGGWDSNIPGFWIAKYPAGFQKSTITASSISETATIDTITLENGNDTIEWSTEKYTTPGSEYTNALGQLLTVSNITAAGDNVKISYPVFKPLTYVYNAINIDSSFRISQEIANATEFYGLENVDSHLMKNSEWGAVVYLAWSQYGRNATESNINNVSLENTTNAIYAVTGIYADETRTASTAGKFTGNAYNTATGQLGSSTGNITGVYDLNGCVFELTTSYIENLDGETVRNTYGTSVISADEKYKIIYASGNEELAVDGNDIDDNTDNEKRVINYTANSVTTRYGDAVLETSTTGYSAFGWNSDYSIFSAGTGPFLARGCTYANLEYGGFFAFCSSAAAANNGIGFRVSII